MDDSKVVVLQTFMPVGHPPIQFLWGLSEHEVFVVGLNDEGGFGPDKVGSPVLQCFDDH